jgi:hypothetical protein
MLKRLSCADSLSATALRISDAWSASSCSISFLVTDWSDFLGFCFDAAGLAMPGRGLDNFSIGAFRNVSMEGWGGTHIERHDPWTEVILRLL